MPSCVFVHCANASSWQRTGVFICALMYSGCLLQYLVRNTSLFSSEEIYITCDLMVAMCGQLKLESSVSIINDEAIKAIGILPLTKRRELWFIILQLPPVSLFYWSHGVIPAGSNALLPIDTEIMIAECRNENGRSHPTTPIKPFHEVLWFKNVQSMPSCWVHREYTFRSGTIYDSGWFITWMRTKGKKKQKAVNRMEDSPRYSFKGKAVTEGFDNSFVSFVSRTSPRLLFISKVQTSEARSQGCSRIVSNTAMVAYELIWVIDTRRV